MDLNLETYHLVAVQCALIFDIKENAVLDYGGYLSKIAKAKNGKINQLNTPREAPPEIPRIVMQTSDLDIKLCLNRLEVVVRFGKETFSSKNLGNFPDFQNKLLNIRDILKDFLLLDDFKQDFSGILAIIHFPQKDFAGEKSTFSGEIFKLVHGKPESVKNIHSFGWKIGYLNEHENCFINYDIKKYETREFKIPNTLNLENVKINLDLNKIPVKELGVELIIDINNRPKENKADFVSELQALEDAFSDEPEAFFKFIDKIKD